MGDHEARLAFLEARLNATIADYDECLDTVWMLLASMLVFFMHSGFSLLEAGSVRIKNAQNILAKNLVVVTFGFLCWFFIGYALALGLVDTPGKFSGGTHFAMDGFGDDRGKFRVWFFQGTFCATGGTIVSGAMAERTQLKGFGIFTILMTSLIYPLVVYWCWSKRGFLNYPNEAGQMESIFGPPYIDFAGSGVVHLVGGVGALVGALVVGPRKGRFVESEDQGQFAAHNVPLCVLGTFFLWFGWYGFNPGSTLLMHTKEAAFQAAQVAINTTISPCVAGLTVFFLRARVTGARLDVGGFCNGILAGLVAITAGCAQVKAWEAMIIGFVGGCVYQGVSMTMVKLQIDDVVDAFAVHGANGFWAVISVGLFGNPAEGNDGNGFFYGGDQLRTQVCSGLLIILWSGSLSTLIFLPLRLLGMLRMSNEFQDKGADAMEHSPEKAYAVGAADVEAS